MIEVEEKYRVTSEIASRISALTGASDPVREVDEIYLLRSTSWKDFSPGEPVIRLRLAGPDVTLTVKAALNDTTASESEVEVACLAQARETIGLLGATSVSTVSKVRRKGQYLGISVCVDDVDHLGEFVELEIVVSDASDEAVALKRLATARHELGLLTAVPETERYDTLLERHAREHSAAVEPGDVDPPTPPTPPAPTDTGRAGSKNQRLTHH